MVSVYTVVSKHPTSFGTGRRGRSGIHLHAPAPRGRESRFYLVCRFNRCTFAFLKLPSFWHVITQWSSACTMSSATSCESLAAIQHVVSSKPSAVERPSLPNAISRGQEHTPVFSFITHLDNPVPSIAPRSPSYRPARIQAEPAVLLYGRSYSWPRGCVRQARYSHGRH